VPPSWKATLGEEAVFAEVAFSEATIRGRLRQNLATVSRKEPRYQLSFSLGAVRFDPRTGTSIAQLMCQADRAMHEHKTQQRKPSTFLV